MVTKKQREVAEELTNALKDIDLEEIRENIREENEYFKRKEQAQKPTREQMQQPYDL